MSATRTLQQFQFVLYRRLVDAGGRKVCRRSERKGYLVDRSRKLSSELETTPLSIHLRWLNVVPAKGQCAGMEGVRTHSTAEALLDAVVDRRGTDKKHSLLAEFFLAKNVAFINQLREDA